MIGLASCNTTKKQNALEWQQNLSDVIPYKIKNAHGVSVKSINGRHIIDGKDGFKLVLAPEEGDFWNMESVSILGLALNNTGRTEMILDLMLCNEGATDWSNSSLGRTIVKPGEQVPLAVVLTRTKTKDMIDNSYLRMSGRPNGHRSHWHTIDPSKVKELVIKCNQKGDHSFELAQMFPMQKMDDTLKGKFPFIDKYGQYIFKDWPDKVYSDKDIIKSIALEKKLEQELSKPTGFTKYGGFKDGPKFEATGFFRTQRYKNKWWFVDPDGYLFWSYGVNTVGIEFAGQTPVERNPSVFEALPAKDDKEFGQFHVKIDVEENYSMLENVPHYDFTRANLYRKYGKDWAKIYAKQDVKRLQYCNINTIGAWSDDEIVAQKKIPYTAMVHYEYAFAAQKLPDPFNPETRTGLRKALNEYPVAFKDDPWCLGALISNELHWTNNSRDMISSILSYEQANTEVKKFFKGWLQEKYNTVAALNEAWKTQLTDWDDLLKVNDKSVFKNADSADCSALTTLFAETFFRMVTEELDSYSPGTLYLGCRFHVAPPEVIKTIAKYADVVSANIYSYSPTSGRYSVMDKPILITEFHFVNVSGNNLGSGLRSAQDSVQQGRLFREYITRAIEHPQIIGAHWFQWRDQNVGGRFDGENYDVGFFDVADIPNEDLIRAAEERGRNLYNCIK